jgi:hypothetical protein
MTFHKPARKSLRDTILANRQQLTAMAKLAGKEPPVFSDMTIPKAVPAYTPSEAQILKSIMAYLRVHPKVGWNCRINCGSFEVDGRYIQNNSQPGMSDIIGCLRESGRMFAIEVKSQKGRLSEQQALFLSTIENAGGLSCVAKSIDDVSRMLDLQA